MSEFTGERVVPGQVNDDLWAEHVARYAFAERFAAGKRVLDAGCGTGYGSRELARAAKCVTGIDVATEAVTGARESGVCCQASVSAMPFRAASFNLVVAFEVIEHLQDWRPLLCESRRVLAEDGLMVVSTPNRDYYTQSRGTEGPNPFHVHEFEFEEFREALCEFFPQVRLFLQNRVECFAFHDRGGLADASVGCGGEAKSAHFFIGVCGVSAIPELHDFVYVPRAANLLREREQHIRMLEGDLAKQIGDHSALQREHEQLMEHLEEKNRWALDVETQWRTAQERIVQLQGELKELQEIADRRIAELEADNRASTEWATELDSRLGEKANQLAATVRLLDSAESTVVERTLWAQRLDKDLAEVRAQLAMARESRWVKLGRSVGVGPKL